MKIKQSTREKYAYFLSCTRPDEPRPLNRIAMVADGKTAIECFHIFESTGELPACREPELLERYLKGKEWHGVTVQTVAEDFAISRIAFSKEINANYPPWVADEIFQQAKKIALNKIGYMPTFVEESMDWSDLPRPP